MSSTSANSLRIALFTALLASALPGRAQDEPTVGGFKLSEFPAAGTRPIFRMVSAGAEPRQELRYRLASGSTHSLVMTMRMSVGVEIDGRGAPVQRTPAMRMILEYRVIQAGDAEARVDFSITRPPELFETEGVAPATLEAMRKTASQISSIRGQVAMTNRGIVRESRVEVGPQVDPNVAQMIESMHQSIKQSSVALPQEVVGIGAEWKALQQVQGAGIGIFQVATFKVERIEGSVVTMAVMIEQFAPRQDLAPPPNAPDTHAELSSMQGSGEGHTAVDLTSPVPRSDLAVDSTVRMSIRAPDRTMQMGVRNRMQVRIEPETP